MGVRKLEEFEYEEKLFYKIEDLIRLTGYTEDTLKKYFLEDSRVLKWQRRPVRGGHRIWMAKETREAIKEIALNDWIF